MTNLYLSTHLSHVAKALVTVTDTVSLSLQNKFWVDKLLTVQHVFEYPEIWIIWSSKLVRSVPVYISGKTPEQSSNWKQHFIIGIVKLRWQTALRGFEPGITYNDQPELASQDTKVDTLHIDSDITEAIVGASANTIGYS